MCFYSPRMSCIMSQKTLKPMKDKSGVLRIKAPPPQTYTHKQNFVLALTLPSFLLLFGLIKQLQSPATCVTAEFAQFTGTTTNENDINIYINVYRYINTTAFLYKKSEKMHTKFSILT